MKRASYRDAIRFISLNDEAGASDALDAEVVKDYVTVVMVSELFQIPVERIAKDIVAYRERLEVVNWRPAK